MNPLEQIVLGAQSLWQTARLLGRPSLWAPWSVLLGLELMIVLGLWWFAHPALSWLLAPLIRRLAGEDALHYPDLFRFLPGLYAKSSVPVLVIVGAIASGASTALFGAWFSGHPLRIREGLRRGLLRTVGLVLANLPFALLLVAFSFALERWLRTHERFTRFAPILTFLVAAALQTFFVWVNPLLMLGRRRLVDALTSLPEAAAIGAWTAWTIAALAALPALPIQMMARNASRIVEHGTPERVGWLMVAQAVAVTVGAFLLTGASALAYQSLVGPVLEEEV